MKRVFRSSTAWKRVLTAAFAAILILGTFAVASENGLVSTDGALKAKSSTSTVTNMIDLTKKDESNALEEQVLGTAVVKCKKGAKVPVFKKASASSKKIANLKKGDSVDVLAVTKKWYKVLTQTGKVGFIRKKSLTPDEELQLLLDNKASGNEHIVCELTPVKDSYKSGENISFKLQASYASAKDEDPVTIYIKLPKTDPALQMIGFELNTDPNKPGVPALRIASGDGYSYLYWHETPTAEMPGGYLEITLEQGDALVKILKMSLPNGLTQPIDKLTLTPEFAKGYTIATDDSLKEGTTKIEAEFGWKDIQKTGSLDNIGEVDKIKPGTKLEYHITADSLANNKNSGAIFTKNYKISDTISLKGLYFNLAGELTHELSGEGTLFKVGGSPVLYVSLKENVTVETVKDAKGITGYKITVTAVNGKLNVPEEVPNIDAYVQLYLDGLKLSGATGEDIFVKNTAQLDAYSVFYDENAGKTGAPYHHESAATHTAYTLDAQHIEKSVYTDAATKNQASYFVDGNELYYKIEAHNDGATGVFDVRDVLVAGLEYKTDGTAPAPASVSADGKTITWKDITIKTGEAFTAVVHVGVTKEFGKFDLINRADLLKNDLPVDSATRTNIRIASFATTAGIDYEKKLDNANPGVGENIRFTITAKNNTQSDQEITVIDDWPGNVVKLTAIDKTCPFYEIVMTNGKTYTDIGDILDGEVVDKVRLYSIPLKVGKSKDIVLTGRIISEYEQLSNSIEGGAAGSPPTVYAYSAMIKKDAFLFENGALGSAALTERTPVKAGDTVCYRLTLTNKRNTDIASVFVIDELPAGMSPVANNVTYNGVSGKVFLLKNGATTVLSYQNTSNNSITTGDFSLEGGKSATVLVFVDITTALMNTYSTAPYTITNKAKLCIKNGIETTYATADIFTFDTNKPQMKLFKGVLGVADYKKDANGDYVYLGRNTLDFRTSPSLISYEAWEGAYVVYQIGLVEPLNIGPYNIYEVVDQFPAGIEYIGLSLNGDYDAYRGMIANSQKLSGSDFIYDGTGTWKKTDWNPDGNVKVNCDYDKTNKRLTIKFLGDDGKEIPFEVHAGNPSAARTYFHVLARVTNADLFETNKQCFKNTVKVKIDATLDLYGTDKPHNELDVNDPNYRYVFSDIELAVVDMIPGLEKEVKPAQTGTSINTLAPDDPLLWTLRVKSEDDPIWHDGITSGSEEGLTAICSYTTDFTVVDYLPAEFEYIPGTTTIILNDNYDITTGKQKDVSGAVHTKETRTTEPAYEVLADGRKKLIWNLKESMTDCITPETR